ncbi:NADH-quinone oxidoreductase subunit N [Pedosphaera parvula]|uniref:NADH-quinone oxidoreductase subunit N n=1 Tax=Pedosphaera parvula (strain Ellin514) TaxID=320771 RepID=B9XFX0_PEDPL|nr:NADH-quinone oxidoreductase subunit N [Pedosphaera parvula]EEF61132.1 proton-translocating NADH-quinone oxidoreductase, chain N [Pedosphaera parvula Ellin514]
MSGFSYSYSEILKFVAPEFILSITALVVLASDLLVMREKPHRYRFRIGAALAGVGCVAAIAWLLSMNLPPHAALDGGTHSLLVGMYTDDLLVRLVKTAVLIMAIFTTILSMESNFTDHIGEYLALILLATVGMLFLISAEDLLMVFIALELTSLSLYVLTAFNKRNIQSAEAALKYFLFGGTSAAFTLFGISLVYGVSGSTRFFEIAANLSGQKLDPLLLGAIVMTVIGFGFKVAAVPFHLWAPDAYQGAPTPSAALIASGSKVASFFIFARVMMKAFEHAPGNAAWHQYAVGWMPVIAIVATCSLVVGNLAAIVQSNVKRLLAYSAIAHAGYALLGLLANTQEGMTSLIYYVITYGLTVLGAFGVVAVVEEKSGKAEISDFAGFGRREPLLAGCMLVFMLSLAGIPPLAGFFGKFYLFTAAAGAVKNLGLLWLVILAIAMSAVSLYYYLQVLKQIYVVPGDVNHQITSVPISSRIAISVLALAVVILGCAPNILVGRLVMAMEFVIR